MIAAITSCTNTSNPSVMVAAGLLARNAVARGLRAAPHVKTSLAPGSRVVTDYLATAGLQEPLDTLGFQLVGYGCTTCIGNSGPLLGRDLRGRARRRARRLRRALGQPQLRGPHPPAGARELPRLSAARRRLRARGLDRRRPRARAARHRQRRAQPSTCASCGRPATRCAAAIEASVTPELFEREYATIWDGDERWRALPAPEGALFAWDPDSTYVREPPFFQDIAARAASRSTDIVDARCLVLLGDSVTTDHISPAGAIPRDMPAGRYLHGARGRAARLQLASARAAATTRSWCAGTFGNIRLRNALADGTRGRLHGAPARRASCSSIFDAAERYAAENVPLVVLAGKEYGSGSSRDWAAKGTLLLGIRAVIAESFERIHRSNLVGHGRAAAGATSTAQTLASLGLDGRERFTIRGIAGGVAPHARVTVEATADDGTPDEASRRSRASTRRPTPSTCATAASSRSCCGA